MPYENTAPGNAMPETEHKQRFLFPWWMGYLIDNPLRRLLQPPEPVVAPYVRPGMTVMDYGCGFGIFSLAMAGLVGDTGRVLAVDLQPRMLDKTMSRARKAGLDRIIEPVTCGPRSLNGKVSDPLDFILVANVLHETPDPAALLAEFHTLLKPGRSCYVMEPWGHVGSKAFENEIRMALGAGFVEQDRPDLKKRRCVLLQRPNGDNQA